MNNSMLVQSNETVKGFDKTAWLDKLVILQDKIDRLEELASKDKGLVDKNEIYVVGQLYKLITKMVNCDQYDTDLAGRSVPYHFTNKVVRVYRYIPNYVLDYNKHDRVVTGGLYIEAPVVILDGDLVNAASKNRYGAVLHPEEFSLPAHDKVNYATLKSVGNGNYMALAKGTWLDDHITTARHWDYVIMD